MDRRPTAPFSLLLRFALDGLAAQRVRSALTVVGMAIGTASVVGMRDGAAGGFPDMVSEHFFFVPNQVPAEPNDLLETPALDDFGEPIVNHEGQTVREFILAQLAGNAPTRPPFTIHPGGDVQISGGR